MKAKKKEEKTEFRKYLTAHRPTRDDQNSMGH